MMYGIEHKVEPPEPVVGNAYELDIEPLPTNLRDALRLLSSSEMMKHYLGSDFVEVFVTCKEKELEQFEKHITDIEYDWYLHSF